jgi:hypothetical protein
MFSIHFISQIDHDFASFSKMDLSHKLAIVVRGVICEMLSTQDRRRCATQDSRCTQVVQKTTILAGSRTVIGNRDRNVAHKIQVQGSQTVVLKSREEKPSGPIYAATTKRFLLGSALYISTNLRRLQARQPSKLSATSNNASLNRRHLLAGCHWPLRKQL